MSNGICDFKSLEMLYMDDNAGLTCYPSCMTSLFNFTVDESVMSKPQCPSFQDVGLCGLIAATSVGVQYAEWSCTTDGLTSTNPCDAYSGWRLITCSHGYVNSISSFTYQSGKLYCIPKCNWKV